MRVHRLWPHRLSHILTTLACLAGAVGVADADDEASVVALDGYMDLPEACGEWFASEVWGINPSGKWVGALVEGVVDGVPYFYGFRSTADDGCYLYDICDTDNSDVIDGVLRFQCATSARSINPSGDVVGYWRDSQLGVHGWLWRNGDAEPVTLDAPGAIETQAFGINPRGEVVGSAVFPASATPPCGGLPTPAPGSTCAFRLRGDPERDSSWELFAVPGSNRTVALGISSSGTVVGQYTVGGRTHAFVRNGSALTTVDVDTFTSANGVNTEGDIVGPYSPNANGRGFRGAFLLLGGATEPVRFVLDGSQATHAAGINPRGDIVGWYDDLTGRRRGYVLPAEAWD